MFIDDGGIGSAVAVAFSNRGFRVYATARRVESMKELQNKDSIILLPLDVLETQQIMDVVGQVSNETDGKLDFLFSNAGQTRFMPLLDEDVEAAKALFDTNAKGIIVFNTSVSGHLNVPWQGSYAASKRSLEILGDNLRLELAPFDVKVVSIVTGAVESKVHSHYRNWKLPENSRYAAIEESFTKRAKGDDGSTRMDNHRYAEGVVGKLLKIPGPKFWYGAAVGIVKFAVAWFPTSWLDKGLASGTGIDIILSAKR